MLRLNLGSHDVRVKGWLNVDIQAFPAVDIQCDVRYLDLRLEADVLRASHVLEHLWPSETQHVLRNWHERLKPGGWLYVSVPDFDWVVSYYLKHSTTSLVWCEQRFDNRVLTEIYGQFFPLPDNGVTKYARHRALFSEHSLRSLLESAGFVKPQRFDPEKDELMCPFDDAMKLPWSLNMRCVR